MLEASVRAWPGSTAHRMKLVIVGAMATAYCALWFAMGLTGRRIPDNLMRFIKQDDERYKVMIGAYAVGLIIGLTVLAMGLGSR